MKEGSVLLGKYRVERIVGQGGMGVVVAARHEQLDDRVAIKLMLPAVAENPEAVTRFVREARAAAKIKGEHVARVSDVGTLDTGQPYMVMEYLEGSDLSVFLQQSGRVPLEHAVDYLLQACDAIAQAHELGIVHRDLKPANLFLTRRRDGMPLVKVLDFGISKMTSTAVDSSMTRTSALMGSPLYMSPEQMTSARDVDRRTDIWALGVIFYELLSGMPPFDGDTLPQVCAMILQGATPNIRERFPDVPEAVAAVIARCLERDPAKRFATVDEFARALAPFSATGGWDRPRLTDSANREASAVVTGGVGALAAGTHSAWGETAPEIPVRRLPWGLAVGAAVAAVVVIGGVVTALRSTPSEAPAELASTPPPSGPATAPIAAALVPTPAPTEAPKPAAPTVAPTAAAATLAPLPSASSAKVSPKVSAEKPPRSGAALPAKGTAAQRPSATPPNPASKEPAPALVTKPAAGTKAPSAGSLGGRL